LFFLCPVVRRVLCFLFFVLFSFACFFSFVGFRFWKVSEVGCASLEGNLLLIFFLLGAVSKIGAGGLKALCFLCAQLADLQVCAWADLAWGRAK
jgi:hypothetical protein